MTALDDLIEWASYRAGTEGAEEARRLGEAIIDELAWAVKALPNQSIASDGNIGRYLVGHNIATAEPYVRVVGLLAVLRLLEGARHGR